MKELKRYYTPIITTIFLLLSGHGVWGQVNIFSETFSSITSGNNTSSTGANTAWGGNINFPTVALAYSAGDAVKIGSGSAIGSITSKILDLSVNGGNFTLSFDVKGWTTVEGNIKITIFFMLEYTPCLYYWIK